MRRRDLIAALGATAAWSLPAGAQPKTIPVVGMLRPTPRASDLMEKALRSNMAGLGWQEGRTVAYQFAFTEGDSSRLQELAAELVRTRPAVLVASGYSSLRALQDRTRTIPIVGILSDDFVGQGVAFSMARPGGNVTGVSILGTQLEAKRLELLREAIPSARRIGVIIDPAIPVSRGRWQAIDEWLRLLGRTCR
jgi:putative tryptophan/tyrosine transport system substrate-binding protein